MKDDNNNFIYDESSIESYENTEAIRKRPTMYIEELGQNGVLRLAIEVFGNVVDEFLANRAKTMYVTIDERNSKISVEDDGAGIPVGKLIDICTKTHTGGKFHSKAYKRKIGQNGVGLKAVNALSKDLEIIVMRDSKKFKVRFSKGKVIEDLIEIGKSNITGTIITFMPDETIFSDIKLKIKTYTEYLKKVAYINPGLRIKFNGTTKDGKNIIEEFYSTNGLADYLKDEIAGKHDSILIDPIVFHDENNTLGMGISVAFTYCSDVKSEIILSFVNGIPTRDHGFHVIGFKKAIAPLIISDLKESGLIPKKDILYESVCSDDTYEGLVCILLANHNNPVFDGQTKNKFSSLEFEPYAKEAVSRLFKEWTDKNYNKYKNSILRHVMINAKARLAANKARNLIKNTNISNTLTGLSNSTKFENCSSKISEERELYIVEGESAGGSVIQGRDSKTQAIYKLTGKPQNVYGISNIDKILTKDSEIKDIIGILGCGFGDTFDISKLNFGKIVFLCDADDDGYHIAALLSGFFYKYYKELITAGKIYIANPPLFKIKIKSKDLYIINKYQYYKVLETSVVKLFNLVNNEDKKLSEDFFKIYLKKLRGYSDLLNSIASQCDIHPYIIESIIIYYNEIFKYNRIKIGNDLLDIIKDNNTKKYIIQGVYLGKYYKITIDSFFLNNVCLPIATKLKEIKYYNLYLKNKNKNLKLGPSPYIIDLFINSIISNNSTINRFKGLGEMNPEQLWHTVLNKENRVFTRITLNNIDNFDSYDKYLDMLIGKDIINRKEYYKKYM